MIKTVTKRRESFPHIIRKEAQMEIERKFLIPDVYVKELFERDAERLEIEQYYVTVGTTEERYRRVNGDCFFAVKRDTGSSLSRLETETPCGGNDFEKNLPEKKRTVYVRKFSG